MSERWNPCSGCTMRDAACGVFFDALAAGNMTRAEVTNALVSMSEENPGTVCCVAAKPEHPLIALIRVVDEFCQW